MFHVNYPHRLITNALTFVLENGSRRFDYKSKTTGILVFYINITGNTPPYFVSFKENSTGLTIASHALARGTNYFHFLCNKGNELSFYLADEFFYKELAIMQYPLTEHYESAGNEEIEPVYFQLDYGNKIAAVSKSYSISGNNKEYSLVAPVDGLLLAQVTTWSTTTDYRQFNSLVIQDNHMYYGYLVSGLNVTSCFCSRQDKITYTIHKDIPESPQFTFVPFRQ